MTTRAIPNFFFLNDELHKKIKIIQSDDSVVTWCYRQEKRLPYPRSLVRKGYKKAFTISAAAKLINVSRGKLQEVFDQGLAPMPEWTYNLANYQRGKAYVNEDNMLEIRQTLWDLLPKNRFGEPYNDTMTNEKDLLHAMMLGDDRDFVIVGDEVIRIFRA